MSLLYYSYEVHANVIRMRDGLQLGCLYACVSEDETVAPAPEQLQRLSNLKHFFLHLYSIVAVQDFT